MSADDVRASLARMVRQHPDVIGRAVGFKDMTPLHGEWIREMVFGEGDYTLQAHRGSYKSSCLAVSIALIMITDPKRNLIFLRKTDSDVTEMMVMVSKILKSPFFSSVVRMMYNQELALTAENSSLSTAA